MEFEDLDELIDWEARYVVTAFGIETFESKESEEWERSYRGDSGDVTMWWTLDIETLAFNFIGIRYASGNEAEMLSLFGEPPYGWEMQWKMTTTPCSQFRDLLSHRLAYGLYRLGFEDEDVWAQLPQLTAHEKLELRLSLPREFWPQKWLNEEG